MLPASAKEERHGQVPSTGDNYKKRGSKAWCASSLHQKQVVGRDYVGGSRGSIYFFFALIAVGLLLGPQQVLAQEDEYVNGGDVSMACSKDSACSCSGSAEDGTEINVFDYPTSGERIVSVDGGYSGILETSCGTEAIAAGDTLYTLNDVELKERGFDVVSMSSAECSNVVISKPADCYRGETFSTLDGDIEVDITICYCKHVDDDGDFIYKSNLSFAYTGAADGDVESDELHICSKFDFIAQMATFVVGGASHYFEFELDIPDEDTSSLSVERAPPSSAGAFLCGVDPTPSPEEPTPPTEEPTSLVATTAPASPSPVPALPTPAPTLEPDTTKPSATPDTPLQTSAPVPATAASTILTPSVASTPGPTPTITVVDSSSGSTPAVPIPVPTGAPIGVAAPTIVPTATGSGAHNSPNTTAPSNSGRSLSPVPSGVTTEPTSAANTSISLDFEDNTLSVAGGNGVALVALGVLSVLTFLPSCVK